MLYKRNVAFLNISEETNKHDFLRQGSSEKGFLLDIFNSLLLLSLSLALSSKVYYKNGLFIGRLSQVPATVTAKVTN